MFFWLAEHFRGEFGPLNVFRYVTFRTLIAFVTAFVITMALYPWFIRTLRAKQIGQTVRTDGPQSHFVKSGTPTMGGSLLIMAVVASSLMWMDPSNPFVWMTLAVMVGYGIVGFVDDFRKYRDRNSKGVSGKTKLFWQFSIAGIIMVLFFSWIQPGLMDSYSLRLYIPFLRIDQYYIELPAWLYATLACFVLAGTSNGVNLTDGLDGLAIGPVITSAATFLVLCYLTNLRIGGFDVSAYLLIPKVPGVQELTIVTAAIIGAGIGFLWYNTFPAQVFMGDVGALGLGGALGCLAVFTKNELLSLIIFGIFVLESVSVITQTVSYKLTGKRIFRMAPLHHHYELKGWPEPKIIVRFWIVALLLSVVAFANLKLR
ncbi:MAG: phospho-N-acetylmuramoyl-pentapeptide-transferase [Myxococcales bacterium]|nr:phospho-N-acetylmuramoyl-pentapeptide-transferase [Myxococcales bacterium]